MCWSTLFSLVCEDGYGSNDFLKTLQAKIWESLSLVFALGQSRSVMLVAIIFVPTLFDLGRCFMCYISCLIHIIILVLVRWAPDGLGTKVSNVRYLERSSYLIQVKGKRDHCALILFWVLCPFLLINATWC